MLFKSPEFSASNVSPVLASNLWVPLFVISIPSIIICSTLFKRIVYFFSPFPFIIGFLPSPYDFKIIGLPSVPLSLISIKPLNSESAFKCIVVPGLSFVLSKLTNVAHALCFEFPEFLSSPSAESMYIL